MKLTVQIVTRNDESTIEKTIKSLLPYRPEIIIGDINSQDHTVSLCKKYPVKIKEYNILDYAKVRNDLNKEAKNELKLYLFGNEEIYSGLEGVQEGYSSILSSNYLSKEFRVYTTNFFMNQVFECLSYTPKKYNDLVIYKHDKSDDIEKLMILEGWRKRDPMNLTIDYYEALVLLSMKKYDQFINICNHYFFIHNDNSLRSTMLRYYYAMAYFIKNKPLESLQNLVICLANKPTMAEFWCLAGDVYYYLYNNIGAAKELYQNAFVLGKYRTNNDHYPMELVKYDEYPNKMLADLISTE